MATEYRPPFPPGWNTSRAQRDKLSKSPPVAFDTKPVGRGHFRSPSFGGFVSRLLPSHRQEKGHTLRSQFNDDGTQDAVGLVFNLPSTQSRNSSTEHKGFGAAIKRSWPRKVVDATVDCQTPGGVDEQSSRIDGQPEQFRRFSLGDMVGIARRTRQSGSDETRRAPTTGDMKKVNALSRMIDSLKRTKGEQKREKSNSDLSQSQTTQLLESRKSCLEVAKVSDEKEITKAQWIIEDKKFHRDQRRYLRDSGDFLGVQGANPRTGYWDISDTTSSTEQSRMSEQTKLKLDQQVRELAEQKKKYEEAQKSHRAELMRLEALKEFKKKEKEEQKKIDSKMRQRRTGKWRATETGWSSVFEPELSPILQSEPGTPVAELAPGDRLFPMPCAADPNPYVNDTPIEQGDYFGHRVISSPLAHKRPGQSTGVLSITPRDISIPRKPVGLPRRQRTEESSETIIHTHNHSSPSSPIQSHPSSKEQQQSVFHPHGHPAPSIRVQEPVTGQIEQQTAGFNSLLSSDSVQKSFLGTLQQQQSKLTINPLLATTGKNQNPPPAFLEIRAVSSKRASPLDGKATVISFRSDSTKHVAIRPPLVQSLGARRIVSLNELPPITLKDPIAARIPSSYQPPKAILTTWVPPKNLRTLPVKLPSYISTSTTTTTGCAPLLLLSGQGDGASDIQTDTPTRQQSPQHRITQVPPRTSSRRKNRLRATHRTIFPTRSADIAILSEHQLNLTKERSMKLCQTISPELDKGGLKSTLISISTCPPSLKSQAKTAQSAALLAFQQLRRQAANNKAGDQNGGQLTLLRKRKQKGEEMKDTNTERVYKPAQDENVDIGDPSKIEKEQGTGSSKVSRLSPVVAARAAALKFAAGDKLAVWHPEPNAEKVVREMLKTGEKGAPSKTLVLYERRGVSSEKVLPTPGRRLQLLEQAVTGMAQGAWLVVEFVLDAHSDMRTKFERRPLTWQDAGVFIAAAMLMFVAAVIVTRIVGLGLLVGKVLAILFWLFFVF